MKLTRSERRENKRYKRNRMIIGNRSIFTIQNMIIKRGEKSKEKKDNKND